MGRLVLLAGAVALTAACTGYDPRALPPPEELQAVPIFVETERPLGAYVIQIDYDPEYDRVIRIDGGTHPFAYYPNVKRDPEVPSRLTISWFQLGGNGPTGRAHVATLQVDSPYVAELRATLLRALDDEGEPMEAAVVVGAGG